MLIYCSDRRGQGAETVEQDWVTRNFKGPVSEYESGNLLREFP